MELEKKVQVNSVEIYKIADYKIDDYAVTVFSKFIDFIRREKTLKSFREKTR